MKNETSDYQDETIDLEAKAIFQEKVNAYKNDIDDELLTMRTKALDILEPKTRAKNYTSLLPFWPQALVITCVLVVGTIFITKQFNNDTSELSSFELLAYEDEIDMLINEDVEFYIWLERQKI